MAGRNGVVPRRDFRDQAGMPPVPYDGHTVLTDMVADRSTQTFVRPGKNSEGQRTSANRNGGFNLKGVWEVLTEFGLDPVAEIAKALQQRKPVNVQDKEGRTVPKLDENGQPVTVPALDLEVRTKVLMELTSFVHPKLKATEMTIKAPELTAEQVDDRLKALISTAAGRKALR